MKLLLAILSAIIAVNAGPAEEIKQNLIAIRDSLTTAELGADSAIRQTVRDLLDTQDFMTRYHESENNNRISGNCAAQVSRTADDVTQNIINEVVKKVAERLTGDANVLQKLNSLQSDVEDLLQKFSIVNSQLAKSVGDVPESEIEDVLRRQVIKIPTCLSE